MLKSTKKKILSIAIIFLMMCISISTVTFCGNSVAYAEEMNNISSTAPTSLSELQNAPDEQLEYWAANLAQFDGRTYNYITSTKYQGADPICWAYAAVGAAEANILRKGIDKSVTKDTLDFDENYMAWATRNRDGIVDPLGNTSADIMDYNALGGGGFAKDAFAAISQGYALLNQGTQTGTFEQSKYIAENIINIGGSEVAIKEAIVKYGAIAFGFTSPSGANQWATYYNTTDNLNDHSCIIVGWDDTISSSSFKPTAAGRNGAWIVKNSWGDYGNKLNGVSCFYMSYETPISGLYVVDLAMNEDYENYYYYDGIIGDAAATSTFLYNEFAAIYQAKKASATSKELLNAVHIGVKGDDVTCEIKIYTGLTPQPGDVNSILNDPTKGKLKYTQTETFTTRGNYTVHLDNEIELEVGEWFSIVVKVTNPSGDATVFTGSDYNSINDMTYYFDSRYDYVWRNCKYSSIRPYASESANKEVARIRAFTYTEKRTSVLDKDIANALIIINNRFEYYVAGKPFEPDVQVYFGDIQLTEGIDYNLEYKDNVLPSDRDIFTDTDTNIVSAKVIVHGISDYCGSRQELFFVARPMSVPNPPESEITVYNDVETLDQVVLPENWGWPFWEYPNTTILPFGRNTHYATYIGEDANCYRNVTVEITITKLNQDPPSPPTKTSIVDCDITINGSFTYTGSSITPVVKVSFNGNQLTKDKDYTLSFKDNINAGEATVDVTGIGSYAGTVSKKFTIDKADRNLTVTISDWVYGENGTLNVSFDNSDGAIAQYSYRAKDADWMSDNIPINAGSYILTVTIPATVNYKEASVTREFTIAKAVRKVTATIDGWTYGENAKEPIIVWDDEEQTATILYKAVDGGEYNTTVPTNAGNYEVKIVFPETQNYYGKEIVLEFTIAKAAQPTFNGQTEIEVGSEKEKMCDIELPACWQWKNGDIDLTDNMTAVAIYIGEDKDNYENNEIEIHITVKRETVDPNPGEGGEPGEGGDYEDPGMNCLPKSNCGSCATITFSNDGSSRLGLGVICLITFIGALIAIVIIRRKQIQ